MTSILEGELASQVADALSVARVPYALTIVVTIPGGGPDYDPDPPTYEGHACQGWSESYADDEVDGTRIEMTDTRVMVLTSTLDIEPTTADAVTVGDSTYSIINLKRDASGAVLEIQART